MKRVFLFCLLPFLAVNCFADIAVGYTHSGNIQRFTTTWEPKMTILDYGISGIHVYAKYILPLKPIDVETEVNIGCRLAPFNPDGNMQVGIGKKLWVGENLAVGLSGNLIGGVTNKKGLYTGSKALLSIRLPVANNIFVDMYCGFQYIYYPFTPEDAHYLDFPNGLALVFN